MAFAVAGTSERMTEPGMNLQQSSKKNQEQELDKDNERLNSLSFSCSHSCS